MKTRKAKVIRRCTLTSGTDDDERPKGLHHRIETLHDDKKGAPPAWLMRCAPIHCASSSAI
jgi:hypothetical protein